MSYVPEIEFSSQQAIESLQFKKLTALLNYVSHHSPFYKTLFKKNNIVIGSIKNIGDMANLPITTKDDLQLANDDFLCINKSAVVEYTCTSGTLGKPVTIALSKNDLERLAYNEAISFTCAEGSASDLYQLMLTLDRQFMAGLAYYEGIRKLGAGIIRMGPGLPAMQWETIQRLQPTTLVGVPSFVVKLLDYAIANKIDFANTSVNKIICIGENIRDANLQPNVLAKKITDVWDVRLYSTYASTEMQTAFTECRHGAGGHHHPELLIVEILDEQNVPVKVGEVGEICITTLGVEAMPLIRYKTGDMARSYTEKCSCGRITLRLGPIVGRKQQMVKLKGTTLYPPAIFEILNHHPEIVDYTVEAITGSLGIDELKIHVTADPPDHTIVLSKLQASFQSRLRVVPEIIFVDSIQLEKLQGSGQNRKIKRFVDSRTVGL